MEDTDKPTLLWTITQMSNFKCADLSIYSSFQSSLPLSTTPLFSGVVIGHRSMFQVSVLLPLHVLSICPIPLSLFHFVYGADKRRVLCFMSGHAAPELK